MGGGRPRPGIRGFGRGRREASDGAGRGPPRPPRRLAASPRHATVLLAAGRFTAGLAEALDRVHDQLPSPRAVVWWTAEPDETRPAALRGARVVTADTDAVEAVVAAHVAVVTGRAPSYGDVNADVPPEPFEGRGDYGQGGEGMMGGAPFGRPMAMTGDDRDGLALDRWPVTLGPFLVGLPNGLQVRCVMQGGVVQEAHLDVLALGSGPVLDDLDLRGGQGRARHELRWLSEVLRVGGLGALAVRAARAARHPDREERARLARLVRTSGLAARWGGVGTLDGEDARQRLQRRLTGDDNPRPRTEVDLGRVADLLVGQDWSDALVTICSLDLATDHLAVAAG